MVSEGMLPRAAVREVEERLTAAGCPDADFDARELFRLATGRDARLTDRPLDADEAARLEALTLRRAAREPLQYLCGSWPFLDFEPGCWQAWKRRVCWIFAPEQAVLASASSGSARRQLSPAWKKARRPMPTSKRTPVWP